MRNTQAVILAAGLGSRLGKYTQHTHKALLSLNEYPLIEGQIRRLRHLGVADIIIVTGYAHEQFHYLVERYQVKIINNDQYEKTNMVWSFFCAVDHIEPDHQTLILYGDLWCHQMALSQLLQRSENTIAVERNWHAYWLFRYGRLDTDIEELQLDSYDNVVFLGQSVSDPAKQQARYVGANILNPGLAKQMKEWYGQWSEDDEDLCNTNICMTDWLMLCMRLKKCRFRACDIGRRWLEFDTVNDFEQSLEWGKLEQSGVILPE